jgi:hypothetical protein
LDTIFDTSSSSTLSLEQSDVPEFGDNAYHTIAEAYNKPHSFDNNTRDTILHSLAKLNTESGGIVHTKDIIQFLRHFVTEGVNLNWHNRDGHHPLSAFICYKGRRGSETGATLVEYLDALLWKDGKTGELNNINVNMVNGRGATALYEAAVRGEWESVQSLIRARANVNARLCRSDTHVIGIIYTKYIIGNDPRGQRGPSVLQATVMERKAIPAHDPDSHHRSQTLLKVISLLELAGAVEDPTSLQERGRST